MFCQSVVINFKLPKPCAWYLHINSLRSSDAYMRQWSSNHWSRKWLVAWSAPSHYLNQCWDIVNWILRNKLQWNINRNSNIFIQENESECVFCKIAFTLPRPQCVKHIQIASQNDTMVFYWRQTCNVHSIYKRWYQLFLLNLMTSHPSGLLYWHWVIGARFAQRQWKMP